VRRESRWVKASETGHGFRRVHPTDPGSTVEDVLPPIVNRDPGDETADDD